MNAEETYQLKCNQFCMNKVYDDIENCLRNAVTNLRFYNRSSAYKELNQKLLILNKIAQFQAHCFEPITKVEDFESALEDEFIGWVLCNKYSKDNELFKYGLLKAEELIFELENT